MSIQLLRLEDDASRGQDEPASDATRQVCEVGTNSPFLLVLLSFVGRPFVIRGSVLVALLAFPRLWLV